MSGAFAVQKTSRAERRKVSFVQFGILKPDEIVSHPHQHCDGGLAARRPLSTLTPASPAALAACSLPLWLEWRPEASSTTLGSGLVPIPPAH